MRHQKLFQTGSLPGTSLMNYNHPYHWHLSLGLQCGRAFVVYNMVT